jgi:hypothetical protein
MDNHPLLKRTPSICGFPNNGGGIALDRPGGELRPQQITFLVSCVVARDLPATPLQTKEARRVETAGLIFPQKNGQG